jgi:hypothetical protein
MAPTPPLRLLLVLLDHRLQHGDNFGPLCGHYSGHLPLQLAHILCLGALLAPPPWPRPSPHHHESLQGTGAGSDSGGRRPGCPARTSAGQPTRTTAATATTTTTTTTSQATSSNLHLIPHTTSGDEASPYKSFFI